MPQLKVPPQPSGVAPQVLLREAQVWSWQAPHLLGPPPPHSRSAEQPSEALPQVKPSEAQVFGVQVPVPQTLATPEAPQTFPEVQVPQLSVPPQPSWAVPQPRARAEQVFGEQTCAVKQLPPRHCWPGDQALQAAPETPQVKGLAPSTQVPAVVQ